MADAEIALLAGADRVEGTLFGNGERTGNVDIITLAMNRYSHGVDPKLDFSDMNTLVEIYERCTRMHVYERAPYAGALVFAIFSGSHQDAIAKGMKYRTKKDLHEWNVLYIPIDPKELALHCMESDSVLLGAVGGDKWNDVPGYMCPEKGLLRLRAGMTKVGCKECGEIIAGMIEK